MSFSCLMRNITCLTVLLFVLPAEYLKKGKVNCKRKQTSLYWGDCPIKPPLGKIPCVRTYNTPKSSRECATALHSIQTSCFVKILLVIDYIVEYFHSYESQHTFLGIEILYLIDVMYGYFEGFM